MQIFCKIMPEMSVLTWGNGLKRLQWIRTHQTSQILFWETGMRAKWDWPEWDLGAQLDKTWFNQLNSLLLLSSTFYIAYNTCGSALQRGTPCSILCINNRQYFSKDHEFEANTKKHFGYTKIMQIGKITLKEIAQSICTRNLCLWKQLSRCC